jgi:tetratricopeptide (TPR) repeat protein
MSLHSTWALGKPNVETSSAALLSGAFMLRLIGALALVVATHFAYAGSVDDCNQGADFDLKIRGCTQYIREHPNSSSAFNNRAFAYERKGDDDRAIADYNRAIEIDPRNAKAYNNRAYPYSRKGENDRAIADYNRAIELNPNYANAYVGRAYIFTRLGDYDRAIADSSRAIEINPRDEVAYNNRGAAYSRKGDEDRAIADFNRALEIKPIYAPAHRNRGLAFSRKGDQDRALADLLQAARIDPKDPPARLGLGRVYLRKGDPDRAIAELSEAMRLGPKNPEPFVERAAAYEAKGQAEFAIADYRAALTLPATSAMEREAHSEARRRLAAIEGRKEPARPKLIEAAASQATVTSSGRRVALIIANSNYGNAGRLINPANDGRAIAASFRRLGFAEVIERYDLGQTAMGTTLKEFGDKAAGADWAVVYYAGHGIEVNGLAYLIPVDAKLERDTHVGDETVPLSRVLDKVESAQKLRLVILDACRNNPFVARMVRGTSGSRSIGRGLSQIEPEGGVLVAYAAKHGTVAEDGNDGANSPFAEALLANLEEPGLEINFLFRKVRDQVLAKTARRQEPYLYGSLPSESLFFKSSVAR